MEFVDLLGSSDGQGHRAALDAMQELLEALDARVEKRSNSGGRRVLEATRPARRRP